MIERTYYPNNDLFKTESVVFDSIFSIILAMQNVSDTGMSVPQKTASLFPHLIIHFPVTPNMCPTQEVAAILALRSFIFGSGMVRGLPLATASAITLDPSWGSTYTLKESSFSTIAMCTDLVHSAPRKEMDHG